MMIFFLCVSSAPFFMDTFHYSRFEMVEECFITLYNTILSQGLESFSHNELKAIMQKFVNTTLHFEETPLINFQSPYYNYSITDLSLYRASDKYHF